MIVTLKNGFCDHLNPDQTVAQIDINGPTARTASAKEAYNKLADFATGTEAKAQLQMLKSIEGLDLDKLNSGSGEKKQSIEEGGAQLIARFATVDSDARNKLVKLFMALAKSDPSVLTVDGRNVAPVELSDLTAQDEVTIASCFVVNFMLS